MNRNMKPDKIVIELDVSNLSLIDAERVFRAGFRLIHQVDGLFAFEASGYTRLVLVGEPT